MKRISDKKMNEITRYLKRRGVLVVWWTRHLDPVGLTITLDIVALQK